MNHATALLILVILVGICVKEIIAALGIVIVGLKGHEVLVLNIGKSCTAASAELEFLINFSVALGADLIASDPVKLVSHLLDPSASCVDIIAQDLERSGVFVGILIILLADIGKDLNYTLLLIEDLSLEVISL